MAKPIIDLPRGIPKTDRDWLGVFEKINKFLKVVGDQLQIGGEIILPPASVGTTELKPDSVTNDKLRDSAALSVVGRPLGSGGNPTDIIATTADTFFVRRGSALTWDAIQDGDIPGGIARDSDVSGAITVHESAIDPHSQYLTQAEGDGRYRELTDAVTYGELTGKPAVLSLLFSGTGTPEGVVTAGVGSLFLRTDGGALTTLYIKESGAGNTGWVAK